MLTTLNEICTTTFLLINNVIMADGPDFSGVGKTVVAWLNAFIIPMFTIIGGFSIFKLASLGYKIAQAADQPDERRLAVHGIIWWAIGLAVCVAAPVLVNVFLPSLINQSSGGYKPPN